MPLVLKLRKLLNDELMVIFNGFQDIANSHLVVFKDLGHVPHEEDPQATVLAVKLFLKGNKWKQSY